MLTPSADLAVESCSRILINSRHVATPSVGELVQLTGCGLTLPQLLQSLIPCLSCRQCVVDTLEGPGIITSECPRCHRPAWKRDLHVNHKKAAVMHHLQALLAACADSPSGAKCMHASWGCTKLNIAP